MRATFPNASENRGYFYDRLETSITSGNLSLEKKRGAIEYLFVAPDG